MSDWTWICASQIGTSHLRSGQRLQDAFSCFTLEAGGQTVFVGIVSDGAGSASHGGEGASIVCRRLALAVRRHFAHSSVLPDHVAFEQWVDDARDCIYHAAQLRGKDARDFAATLVCAISLGQRSIFAHIGDGCAVVRLQQSQEWIAPTWPEQGEYASMTRFVTEQPSPNLRISTCDQAVDAVCVFSDGIERMVLDPVQKRPFDRFFNGMSQPVFASNLKSGKDAALSRKLADYLGSPAVTDRTDDDKTLVIAALR